MTHNYYPCKHILYKKSSHISPPPPSPHSLWYQSVGQIIGDVLKQLDDDRFIVKASSGPRYVVGCRNKLDKAALKPGTRVSLDMTTLTIMRKLPREVDPTVFHMLNEDPGGISFSEIGGLGEQIRELREVIELPLTNPELFVRVGIKPPKVWFEKSVLGIYIFVRRGSFFVCDVMVWNFDVLDTLGVLACQSCKP